MASPMVQTVVTAITDLPCVVTVPTAIHIAMDTIKRLWRRRSARQEVYSIS